jgi:hypothetical protein
MTNIIRTVFWYSYFWKLNFLLHIFRKNFYEVIFRPEIFYLCKPEYGITRSHKIICRLINDRNYQCSWLVDILRSEEIAYLTYATRQLVRELRSTETRERTLRSAETQQRLLRSTETQQRLRRSTETQERLTKLIFKDINEEYSSRFRKQSELWWIWDIYFQMQEQTVMWSTSTRCNEKDRLNSS